VNLALGALLQARHALARGHCAALLALGRDHTVPWATAWGRCVLEAVALAEGDHETARAGFGEVLARTARRSQPGIFEQAPVSWALQMPVSSSSGV
jgi:hypothetical protein